MMIDNEKSGMTLIVKTVTRLTLIFILLYGIYIGTTGHSSPGGGFAGGVIIALSLMHMMLAFGKDVALRHIHRGTLRVLAGLSALLFLYLILCNPSTHFVVMLLPICEMIIVGAGLFAIFMALVLLSKVHKESE